MRHPEAEGVQRVRCYPFKTHQFNNKTIRNPVFMMPLQPKQDFSLPEDKEVLEYGRVLLFFSILVPGTLGKHFEKDLAFIQYFDHYKVKGKTEMTIS